MSTNKPIKRKVDEVTRPLQFTGKLRAGRVIEDMVLTPTGIKIKRIVRLANSLP